MSKKSKEGFTVKKLADLAFLFLRRCFSPSLSVELCCGRGGIQFKSFLQHSPVEMIQLRKPQEKP
jgi:hypothetical protein